MASRSGKKTSQSYAKPLLLNFLTQVRSPKSPVRGTWSSEEDQALTTAVEQYGAKNWKKIAELVPGRSDVQCLHRWQKVLNPALIKGPWTDEEDERVKELVAKYGAKKWSLIASFLPGRIGKQCRERWANHLDPGVKKGDWQPWEDEMIIKLQRVHGNKWAKMTKDLPGRTDNAIKNRFNSTIQRRLKQEKSPTSPPSPSPSPSPSSSKPRRIAQKISPSSRSLSLPLSYESVSGGIAKRYPSRSTPNRFRQPNYLGAAFSEVITNSPPPSSPLCSLHSYTSEEDFDDNFVGESDEEQSDNTISSDGDFEDPEVKTEAPAEPGFPELIKLCASELNTNRPGTPKIVVRQLTPEGTRIFDSADIVGAAALSSVSDKPSSSYHDLEDIQPTLPSHPLTMAFSRPKRSNANYGPRNDDERKALSALYPSSRSLSASPLSSIFSPASSPRLLRQFIPALPQHKKAKRRLELTEEDQAPNKRPHLNDENDVNSNVANIKNNATNTDVNAKIASANSACSPVVNIDSVISNIRAAAISDAVSHLTPKKATNNGETYKQAKDELSFLAPAKLISLEDLSQIEQSRPAEERSSLTSSDGGFVASLALCELTRNAPGNFFVEV